MRVVSVVVEAAEMLLLFWLLKFLPTLFPSFKADINKAARTTGLNWSQSHCAWTKGLNKQKRALKSLRRRAEVIRTTRSNVGSDGSDDGSDSSDANDSSDGDDDYKMMMENADGGKHEV
jgi:hypothetical protein